ncbi:MAG: hypothetical protein HQL34_08040 [Alphaproteobacteria bacterium]|nr:hypothetical protein [Alphaproteobacteria bacterium]
MPPLTSRITPDDHVAIGASIKAAQAGILRQAPLGSTVHQEAIAVMASLERLRTTMDNLLFQHVHEDLDPRQIRHMVYCPGASLRQDYSVGEEGVQDAFAHWELEG